MAYNTFLPLPIVGNEVHVSEQINESKLQQKSSSKKKPYKKPSFRSEKVFETNALKCSKSPTEGCNPLQAKFS